MLIGEYVTAVSTTVISAVTIGSELYKIVILELRIEAPAGFVKTIVILMI